MKLWSDGLLHLALLALLTGCEALDALNGDSVVRLNLFSTHHATAQEGRFPDATDDNGSRVFTTDDGWNITLTSGFVVTTAAILHHCDGGKTELELFWG